MNCWKEYLAYIKDNPEGYWFKRKLYGYGWTPARPAGWATVAGYLLFIVGTVLYSEKHSGVADHSEKVVGIMVVATILLIVISWRTGEPLQWRWGKK